MEFGPVSACPEINSIINKGHKNKKRRKFTTQTLIFSPSLQKSLPSHADLENSPESAA
jgi:hypothetical protein